MVEGSLLGTCLGLKAVRLSEEMTVESLSSRRRDKLACIDFGFNRTLPVVNEEANGTRSTIRLNQRSIEVALR
jgi:hypothetical protein